MQHRTDLNDAANCITTLFEIGKELKNIEREHWSHWKNKEDYNRIYAVATEHKWPMELIYSQGREFCGNIGSYTNQFVYSYAEYPTVSAIVEKLERYISKLNLEEILKNAISARDRAGFHNNYAFNCMCEQFESQIDIANNIRKIILMMRDTDQYKKENGISTAKSSGGITVHGSNNVNISSGSPNSQQSIAVNDDLKELIGQMIGAVKASSASEKEELIAAIEELRDTRASSASKYGTFINKTKDHIAILAPFIPALTKLLIGG